MFNLYHNLATADDLRCDGADVVGAVSEALKMWKEERKEIVFQVILEKDHEVYYEGVPVSVDATLVEADGRVTPRTVRDAATLVKRFLERTKDTLGLPENVAKVDVVLKNEAHLKLEDQLQAVIDCLHASGGKETMKRYEIEVLEERVGYAQKLSDALHLLFEVSVTDIVAGPNGNPSLVVEVPENWHCARSFKLWLLERPNLTSATAARLDPILAEVDSTHGITDEQYYAIVEGEK